MNNIQIIGANEGNLKNLTIEIPKHRFVVFTGLSGSGKSTLLIDVLFNECQRQYLEAMSMQGIHKPDVERIQGASPAILISQTDANRNPRSTVGTLSDIYTDLRMVYEKLGQRTCPHCGKVISASDCREETEKIGQDFYVYMYCSQCGKRMDKITRTYFSFNTKEGACPACQGLGRLHEIKRDAVIAEDLSLEEGAVRYWEKQYGKYQISILQKAFRHFDIPYLPKTPVKQFSQIQKAILFDGVECEAVKRSFADDQIPKAAASGKFEGVFPILWRRLSDKNGEAKQLEPYFEVIECPQCKGERLSPLPGNVTVNDVRLPELSLYSLERLYQWTKDLGAQISEKQKEFTVDYLLDIQTKLNRFINVGLGYLSLDRQITTLSGGELQRLRLAATLDSELSGVIYILDEPTAGLHPKDTAGLIAILKRMKELGNTVLVIEHDADVMAAADYIIDIGPGSGKLGGEIAAAGSLSEIKARETSLTGSYLREPHPGKTTFRQGDGEIQIKNAKTHNLKNISLSIPTGCMTAVTGPSGSGKSTLIFEVLAKRESEIEGCQAAGLEIFEQIVEIGQSGINRMKRSNVATYTQVYGEIRSVFAKTEAAKKAKMTAKHFSFNSPGGRCENCQGMGYVDNNMLFFANTEVRCPVCKGNRFSEEVLAAEYRGMSIKEVLELSVDEAEELFSDNRKIRQILKLLQEVGLGYLQLGQPLTTLSGGEGQRLKLAKELIGSKTGKRCLYLMDEPTTGLHPKDVEHFLILLGRMVDAGNTVIVVEHNQQLIRNSDWIIDLGPEGGEKGGQVVFEGRPDQIKTSASVTGKYL